jgi:hypothetical protein
VACCIKQNVLRFEITVNNVELVKMLKSQDEFSNVEPRSLLLESTFTLEMPEELSSALVVGHKVELLVRLERELETDKERTLERALQNLALSDRVRHLLFGYNLLLAQYLHGVDSVSVALADLEHSSKSSTTDEFEEFKVGWFEVDLVLPVSAEGMKD